MDKKCEAGNVRAFLLLRRTEHDGSVVDWERNILFAILAIRLIEKANGIFNGLEQCNFNCKPSNFVVVVHLS